MSNFGKRVFAWFLAHGSHRFEPLVLARKRQLFASLRGTVLELGPGAGPNLTLLPEAVRCWIGLEPNHYLFPYLRPALDNATPQSATLLCGRAEQIPLRDGSVDAVLSSLVLCSVIDLRRVLNEVLRVLRPGGALIFMEHEAAPAGSPARRLQGALSPFWQYFADGCHPDREISAALREAGFAGLNIEHFRGPVPVVRPFIQGRAEKNAGHGS